jgi:hypothetical protein
MFLSMSEMKNSLYVGVDSVMRNAMDNLFNTLSQILSQPLVHIINPLKPNTG